LIFQTNNINKECESIKVQKCERVKERQKDGEKKGDGEEDLTGCLAL